MLLQREVLKSQRQLHYFETGDLKSNHGFYLRIWLPYHHKKTKAINARQIENRWIDFSESKSGPHPQANLSVEHVHVCSGTYQTQH